MRRDGNNKELKRQKKGGDLNSVNLRRFQFYSKRTVVWMLLLFIV